MVHVSLDGPAREVHEAVRGRRTFQPTMDGIAQLAAHGVRPRIGCVIHRRNQHLLAETAERCASIGASAVAFSMMEPAGRMRGTSGAHCRRPADALRRDIKAIARHIAGRSPSPTTSAPSRLAAAAAPARAATASCS